jgi:hypothetical protein
MESLGLETKLTDEEWKKLTNTLQESSGALPTTEFETLKNNIDAVSQSGSELNLGTEITKAEYEAMVALNDQLEKNFVLTSSGKYKVINDDFGLGDISDI